ncbi:MAG: NADH-quinone oxidoreductase subunit N [Longimicrobiales bacterium]
MQGLMIDFSRQSDYALALLPEIVLSVWAMLVLLVDVFRKGERSEPSASGIGWLTLAGIVLATIANWWIGLASEPNPIGVIALDSFRTFSNYVFLLAAALFVLIAARYLDEERMRLGELYVLVLFATVGMMAFAGARELMIMFIGLEVMSVPVYVLTGVNRRDARGAEGALKYFLLGAFASAFFLFGIALVYGATGTTNLALISLSIGVDGLGASPLLLPGVALLAVGFAFKISAVPFHMWTPDAYEGAPLPITAFMAAGVKAAAFAAFVRVFLTAFPGVYDAWDGLAIWLAILTMLVANLIALVQGNVKRLLAYSSVAHAGYLLVALAAANVAGAASVLFYLVVYTLMTIGAFAVLMVVAGRGEARLDLDAFSGLGWRMPFLATAMTVFLLSLAGFPLTGGFMGKVYILRAAIEQGLVGLAVALVLTSLMSYFYYLRVAWYMWFREPNGEPNPGAMSGGMKLAIAAAVVGVLFLGIFPGTLLDAAERSAAALMQVPTLLGRN